MSIASLDEINAVGTGKLPGLLGIEITAYGADRVAGRMPVRPDLLAPNGYLHAASVIGLVDTLAGYGCVANLPEGASGFTTVELKSNFLGTALEGVLLGEAVPVHAGRTTQVFDAKAWREGDGRSVALFRCTQMVLYPRG